MHTTRYLFCPILLAASSATPADDDAAVDQVSKAEQAFAATMAARDHEAFKTHIAEDAVFFDGDKFTRGRAADQSLDHDFGHPPAFNKYTHINGLYWPFIDLNSG